MSKVKPGWFVLAAVTLYAVVVTVLLATREPPAVSAEMPNPGPAANLASAGEGAEPAAADANLGVDGSDGAASPGSPSGSSDDGRGGGAALPSTGLWYPIPGARLPRTDANLPGAPREYRNGVSQGIDFHDGDVGVPVPYGAAVIAAADAQVIRADNAYVEMAQGVWELLLEDVEDGADEEELDKLRGRQVWLRTPDGTVLRYGHLSGLSSGLAVGRNVYRGQVIGFVGNSGTDDGVAGNREGARLRFEIWDDDDSFFGEGADAQEVRLSAASMFVGP